MQRLNTQDIKLECDLTLQSMAIEWTEHCILFHLLDYGSINIRALRTVFAQVNCANAETHAGTIGTNAETHAGLVQSELKNRNV